MNVGYARVSTQDQNHNLQRDALTAAGCERIFEDTITGASYARPGLAEALRALQPGDTLTVWKLDRLGRSVMDLVGIVNELHTRQVGFRSLTESIDTTTNGGKLLFHIFGALAEYERGVIKERTTAGLAAARARGRVGGRPRVMDAKKLQMARTLLDSGRSVAEVSELLKISAPSLYRYLSREEQIA